MLTVLRGGGGEERVFVEARVGPFRDALLSVGVPEERQLVEHRRAAALVEVVPVEVGDERCGGVAGEGGHDGGPSCPTIYVLSDSFGGREKLRGTKVCAV